MSLNKNMSSAKISFQIFKRDIKRLLVNPVALIVTIGVCIIPSLYAWYNIVANWDPYGNTGNIKVAVVNNDRGTTSDLAGKLDAGAQVIDKLKKNDQIGWQFVDSTSEAKTGVESGEYYAAIIIPKNFSENMVSMLSGTFHQPKLTYYVNEKKSAVAPKVTDSGASTIEQQVNETFVSTVTKVVVKTAKKAGVDVQAKTDESKSGLVATLEEASSSVQETRDLFASSGTTVSKTKDGVSSADKTLASLNDSIPALTDSLTKSGKLLKTTRSSAASLQASLSTALSGGISNLNTASTKANAAVGKLTGTVNSAATSLEGSLANVQALIDSNQTTIDALNKVADKDPTSSGVIKEAVQTLQAQNDKLASVKKALEAQLSAIKADASAISGATSSVDTAVQKGTSSLASSMTKVNSESMPKLTSGLDSFSSVNGDLKGVVSGLEPTITQARGTLKQLNATLDQVSDALTRTDSTLAGIQENLTAARDDVAALRSSESMEALAKLAGTDVSEVADFMKSPVTLKSKSVYPVSNYGSGVAPFYTNLALWVGGFVLIAIVKLEVDREGVAAFSTREAYFGRWLLLVLLGVVQAVIVCVGDLALGVQCLHPALFILAGVCISFVYVNIIYALAITFKHIGKAVGVILVIVQIPGSSGMYPIEMMPGFFQWLHPFLPFTYGINAMRETIGGMFGFSYVYNLAILAVYVALALVVGVCLRPLVQNLNLLFDRNLAQTGMMICEENSMPRRRYTLRTGLRALLDTDAFRHDLVERAVAFERRYPRYVKGGLATIFGVQILLFALTSLLDLDNDGKIVMLVIWIVAVIAVASWLINIEYIRETLNTQMRLSALSDEKLRAEMREHTSAIPAARRMFGLGARERGSARVRGAAPTQGTSFDGTNADVASVQDVPAPTDAEPTQTLPIQDPKGGDAE